MRTCPRPWNTVISTAILRNGWKMLQEGDSATAATGRMLHERVTIAATLAHRIPGFDWEKAENIIQVATGVEEDDVTNEEII